MEKRAFIDVDIDFKKHPITGDVVRKKGEEAIKQSVKILVLTSFYEAPFQVTKGCTVRGLLFENISFSTAIMIKDSIEEVIERFEPRASIVSVDVNPNTSENGYHVDIIFNIDNVPNPIKVELFLERIR